MSSCCHFQDLERGPFSLVGLTVFLCSCPLPSLEAEWDQGVIPLDTCLLLALVLLGFTVAPGCHHGALVTRHTALKGLLKGQARCVSSSNGHTDL